MAQQVDLESREGRVESSAGVHHAAPQLKRLRTVGGCAPTLQSKPKHARSYGAKSGLASTCICAKRRHRRHSNDTLEASVVRAATFSRQQLRAARLVGPQPEAKTPCGRTHCY